MWQNGSFFITVIWLNFKDSFDVGGRVSGVSRIESADISQPSVLLGGGGQVQVGEMLLEQAQSCEFRVLSFEERDG